MLAVTTVGNTDTLVPTQLQVTHFQACIVKEEEKEKVKENRSGCF
jgi:hypothetical protein